MTELEAVNEILASIGESPVNTIENPTNVDVINCLRILRNVNRRVQSKGWTFNKIDSYTLNPDASTHRIRWLSNLLYVVGTDGTKYTKKGDYLFDWENQTTEFNNSIDCTIIFLVDFEDMPDPMRSYITAKAATTFQTRYLGDSSLGEELLRDEQEAWAALMEYELDSNDFNMLNVTGVQTILERGN
ncbi:phage tail protein [Dialister sp. i34-0019-2H8]|uniref:phage tail protein n=1 Tax=Dialister sp. i34-0019-2H8 TaxID=3141190 RepID=UPI0036F1FE99